MIVDLEALKKSDVQVTKLNRVHDVTPLGSSYRQYMVEPYEGPEWLNEMLIDFGNYWNQAPFSLEQAIILPTSLNISCEVGNLERVTIEGFLQLSKGYQLVAQRCHLCFAPLVKEETVTKKVVNTHTGNVKYEDRQKGVYACGTEVVFENNHKDAISPGADVTVGKKCVKLLKKK